VTESSSILKNRVEYLKEWSLANSVSILLINTKLYPTPILSGKKWKVVTESPVSEFDQALIAVRVL